MKIGTKVAAVAVSAAVVASVISSVARAEPDDEESACQRPTQQTSVSGVTSNGAPYVILVPNDWNGTVLLDFDFGTRRASDLYNVVWREQYAQIGTSRQRSYGSTVWDPAADLAQTFETLQIFRAQFCDPDRVIAIGQSAGGTVALGMAEVHGADIDGAIATCATTPVLTFNQIFDFFYILKSLIGPDNEALQIVNLPAIESWNPAIQTAWLNALDTALATPVGRARLALAFAMAQYPAWGGTASFVPEPDFGDLEAVVAAMTRVAREQLIGGGGGTAGGSDRLSLLSISHQLSVGGGNWVGNTGANYRAYFDNADPLYKEIAETLYAQAGANIQADLNTIDSQPRIALDPTAKAGMYDSQERTNRGAPLVPVFRMDNIADNFIPTAQTQVYTDEIRRNGLDDLYRSVVVNRGGHCNFTAAEEVAAVHVMMKRLDTGAWPPTDADSLNAYAESLYLPTSRGTVVAEADFVEYHHRGFNGEWRLHAYSDKFDLTFEQAQQEADRYAASGQLADAAAYTSALGQAQQVYESCDAEPIEAAFANLARVASNETIVPGAQARYGLGRTASLLKVQADRILATCPPAKPWSATQAYEAGDAVWFDDSLWIALFWTRNQEPGDPYGPWQEIVTTEDGRAVWTPTRVFNGGDVAVHDNKIYVAKWWTRNQTPGDPNGPWVFVTEC